MAGFSQATLERIRAASDIVDVIGSYLPLKRAGANFVALCPFHKEKTPSFNVNSHRQIFHCFGCHKGGDVFTFVKEYENIGFGDAVRRLAERAKIPIEQDSTPGEQQARHVKDQLLEVHEKIAQRWQNCLANEAAGQLARDYLNKRGVSADAVKLFRIGAAPDSWDDTVNWAKSKSYDLSLIEKAGLIVKKEETGNYYDRFRGRLMFPICDEQGRVVAFSGRILAGDDPRKYVNSPETPIFTKSKIFYGLDKSKRAILDAGFAIICEGQLDLIACFMAGVQNIVAPQGTAFTADHVRILKRYAEEAVLCFDSDEAGQKAAMRSLDNLLESDLAMASVAAMIPEAHSLQNLLAAGLAVRVAFIPAPDDPDSFIKKFGGDAFRRLIQDAESFFDYYLRRLCVLHDATTDKGRLAISKAMGEAIQKTGNAILIDTYTKKTALRLGVSPEATRAEFKKSTPAKGSHVESDSPENPAESELSRSSPIELHLLKLLFLNDAVVAWAVLHLDLSWVPSKLIRAAIEYRLEGEKAKSWNLASFLSDFESSEVRSFITEAIAENPQIPNVERQIADVILKLRNQALDRHVAALTQKAGLPETPDQERVELLRRREELRKQKASPLAAIG
ncbi:MAG TPA: DNA primase [Candidatus Sulfotelmatobacter sp.]|nr:DNA primase [Candidatus Sulfotelmatobacter sp.]